jgi:hypothetical protein
MDNSDNGDGTYDTIITCPKCKKGTMSITLDYFTEGHVYGYSPCECGNEELSVYDIYGEQKHYSKEENEKMKKVIVTGKNEGIRK